MKKSNHCSQNFWVTIEGYPNYQVNRMGQIRNVKTGNLLKPRQKMNRYCISISKDHIKYIELSVDKIVANAFLCKIDDDSDLLIIHRDGNIQNCSVDNLEVIENNLAEKEYYSTHTIQKPTEYFTFHPLLEFPESIYEINKMGQIRNKVTHKLVKGAIHKGYKIYVLHINKKNIFRFAHIMVAKQFIPNPNNKPIVNHIDEDKRNPCIDNLEWVTASENARHGTATTRGNSGRSKKINEYDIHGKYIRTWKSKKALSDFINSLSADYNTSNIVADTIYYNVHNMEKRPFANRIFVVYKGNCNDIIVQISPKQYRKYNNINLDGIVVPCEYLVNINSINDRLSILKELLSSNIPFTNMEKKAIAYAIKCVEIIEKESQ